MKRKLIKGFVLSLVALLIVAVPVLAQTYYAYVTVVESDGNDYPMYPAIHTMNTDYLASEGYISATGLDTRVQTDGGEIPHMLSDQWLTFGYPLPPNSSQPLRFTAGNADLPSGAFHTITGYDGWITTPDDTTLEIDDDFDIEQKGWVDTDYVADKNLVYKQDAYKTYISTADSITSQIILTAHSIVQVAQSNDLALTEDYRAGQRIDNFPRATITEAQFYLKIGGGAPVGTAYARVRRVSDDGIIGVLGELDVTTVGAGYAWYTFNTTEVDVPDPQDIRIQFEHADGTVVNFLHFGYNAADTVAGVFTFWSAGPGYTDGPAADATTRIYYEERVQAVASNVASGEHIVKTSIADAPDLADYAADANMGMSLGQGIVPVFMLEKQELTADATTITFSNIDTLVGIWDGIAGVTSRHLVVIVNAKSPDAVNKRAVEITINGDTGPNYNHQTLTGEAGVADADVQTGVNALFEYPGGTDYPFAIPGTTVHADAYGGGFILFPHAFNAVNHKAVIAQGGAAEDYVSTVAGRWASINAVTDLVLTPDIGDFASGSSFILGVVDERYLIEEDYDPLNDFLPVFDGIPADGHDLCVIGYARSDRVHLNSWIEHEINNAAAGVHSYQYVHGTGAGTVANSANARDIGRLPGNNATFNSFGTIIINYSQYAEVANDPHYLSLSGFHESIGSTSYVQILSGRLNNVAAITRLEYFPGGGANFIAGTLFSLYRVPRYTIDRQELTIAAPTITFANIPQNYEALQLLVYARSAQGAVFDDDVEITINADPGPGTYKYQYVEGTGVGPPTAAVNAGSKVIMLITADGEGANEFGGGVITFPKYARTDGHKHMITISGTPGTNNSQVILRSSRWENNDPITDLCLDLTGADNFMIGAVFELVGWMPSKQFMIEVGDSPAFTLEVKGAEDGNITVPDNGHEWAFNQNNVMPYMEYYRASGRCLHFDGSNTSNVNAGAFYNDLPKLWISFRFKLDQTHRNGSPLKRLWGINGATRLDAWFDASGALSFFASRGVGFQLWSTTVVWNAGQWYHVLMSLSDTAGGIQRLLINNVLEDSDTQVAANTTAAGDFVIGDRDDPGAGDGFEGVIANFACGTDDLDPGEETDLYDGIIPADATDIWYMDEGVGVGVGAITSYGTDGNDGDRGANATWQGSGGLDRVWYQPVSYIIGDILPDRLESYQNGVIHWGTNPAGVIVTMGSLTSTTVTEAAAQELVTPDVAPEFMVPPDLFTDDPAGMRNFPLWDTFDFFADVTDTPIIWFWWVMAFALQMVVAIAVHKGFHNLLITGLAMLGMTAMGVAWGILPFWFLLTGGIAVVVAITMERSPTL